MYHPTCARSKIAATNIPLYADPYKPAAAESPVLTSLAAPTGSPALAAGMIVGLAITTTILVRVCLAAGDGEEEVDGEADRAVGSVSDCSSDDGASKSGEGEDGDKAAAGMEVKAKEKGNPVTSSSTSPAVLMDEMVDTEVEVKVGVDVKGEVSCVANGTNSSSDSEGGGLCSGSPAFPSTIIAIPTRGG